MGLAGTLALPVITFLLDTYTGFVITLPR
jgi:hypothetical protein